LTRVIYNTCFADPWLKVAKVLEEKHGFEPVYWIGYGIDDSEKQVPALFPRAIYHPVFDAFKGIFPVAIGRNYSQAHIPIDFIRDFATYELQALKMMDRMDPDCRSFSFSERQRHYRNLVKNWVACIDALKPELVISATIPHRVYDYVLYLLCRHLHIPFLMFDHTAFPGRIIPLRDIASIGPQIKNDYDSLLNEGPDADALKANLAMDILKGYQDVQKDYESGKPDYMEINEFQHRQSASAVGLSMKLLSEIVHSPEKYLGKRGFLLKGFPTYWKRRTRSVEASRLNMVQYAIYKIKTNRLKKALATYYDSCAQEPSFARPYIFLPLHYQPEMTSNPSGDIFVDQSLCVEALSKRIPENWEIYVKEHPAQFQSHGEGQTSRIREFYDDLLKFPKVRLLPMSIDSYRLIANSKAVATVTGTVGWEAMARRKPVLVFGLCWYENYAGVLKIDNEEAADRIFDFIQRFSFDEGRLLAYLAALEKNSLRAYYFRGLKEKMSQPESECIDNLVTAIVRGSLSCSA
jgi:hypothetical protein